MDIILFSFALVFLSLAVWFAWRSSNLRRNLDDQNQLIKDLNLKLSSLNSERDRLAAVLDQMTDGVLIVDSQGRI